MKRFLPILLFFFAFFGIKQSQAGSTCNWGSRIPYFMTWDSCGSKLSKNKGMLNGYIAFNYAKSSCFKYQWTVNGNNVTTNRSMNYMPTANGNYSVCVKVTDTCSGCDTTFCSSMGITCLGSTTAKCNWKSRNPYFLHWDSCGTKGVNNGKIYGYIYFNYAKMSCFKYQWTVNGSNVTTNRSMNYMPTANGNYSVCVKVTDTCSGCDTTFCSSMGITCLGSTTAKCNWKSRNPYFMTWDSCKSAIKYDKIYGYVGFNYSRSSCFKYQWSVNDTIVSTARYFNYQVYSNGSYKICVKILDTCNNCDTLLCNTLTVKCFGSAINNKIESKQITIYPNPTNGILNASGINSSANFIFRDMNGRVLKIGIVTENKIDISEYQQGVYLLSIKQEGIWINAKIIRN